MSVVILDATIWLAAHDQRDPAHVESRALVLDDRLDLTALDLTLYEVANVATVKWHDAELGARLCEMVQSAAATNLIRVDGSLLASATEMAASHRLSVYDGAYAAAAARTGWALVSADADLAAPGLALPPGTFDR